MNDTKVFPSSDETFYNHSKSKKKDWNIPDFFWSSLTAVTSNSDKKERYVKIRNLFHIVLAERNENSVNRGEVNLFNLVSQDDLTSIKNYLDSFNDYHKRRNVASLRNEEGQNIIHFAYLKKKYTIGKWLINNFPTIGIEPCQPLFGDEKELNFEDRQFYLESRRRVLDKADEFGLTVEKEDYLYTGQNIVHITVIQANLHETRWILDFYRYRKDSISNGLNILLKANVTGSFFDFEVGDFYSGSSPLHFTVGIQNTEMFDLVLSYTTSLHDERSFKDKQQFPVSIINNSLYMRDLRGNNILHLAIIKRSRVMYTHIVSTAEAIIIHEIALRKQEYEDNKDKDKTELIDYELPLECCPKRKPLEKEDFVDNNISNLNRRNSFSSSKSLSQKNLFDAELQRSQSGFHKGYNTKQSKITVTKYIQSLSPQDTNYIAWIKNVASIKIIERLTFVLNEQLYSSLTICLTSNDDSELMEDEEREFFEFLLSERTRSKLIFGPTELLSLPLEGVEYPHGHCFYDSNELHLKEMSHMSSCIELLCLTDSFKSADIPIVEKIIESKWELVGRPLFLIRFYVHLFLLVGVTIIGFLINHTPTRNPTILPEYIVNVVYVYSTALLLINFISDVPSQIVYGFSYFGFFTSDERKSEIFLSDLGINIFLWLLYFIFFIYCLFRSFIVAITGSTHRHLPGTQAYRESMARIFAFYGIFQKRTVRGAAKYDKIMLFIMSISYLIFCISKGSDLLKGRANNYYDMELCATTQGCEAFNQSSDSLQKISATILIISTWCYTYFYLMGFESTGPFVLTIYRIVSIDIPKFLKFFAFTLIAFSLALSTLANNGDPSVLTGPNYFWQGILYMFQIIVGDFHGEETDIAGGLAPENLVWLQNFINISFFTIGIMMMLNLLLAMISNTFDSLNGISHNLLLIEKYNIMSSQQMAMYSIERFVRFTKLNNFSIFNFRHANYIMKYACVMKDPHFVPTPPEKLENDIFGPENDDKIYSYDYVSFRDDWKEILVKEQDKLEPLKEKLLLLIIDPQNDFHPEGGITPEAADKILENFEGTQNEKDEEKKKILTSDPYHKEGSLAVAGANEDSKRICDLIDANIEDISEIIVTLDTHFHHHIAHACAWERGEEFCGKNKCNGTNKCIPGKLCEPAPFSLISHEDIKNRKWLPKKKMGEYYFINYEWVLNYSKKLEQKGKLMICIWPPHCIQGTKGHSIHPLVARSLNNWSRITSKDVEFVRKGENLRTEMYSAIKAEVVDPLDITTNVNEELVGRIKLADKVVVCGQALSHCVNYTMRDIIPHWNRYNSDLILLEDCCSSVYNCESLSSEFIKDMKAIDVTVCKSTEVFEVIASSRKKKI